MTQTRLSQFFKRQEIAQVKRKQTSIDVFCVKNACPSFVVADEEVICLEPKRSEEKWSAGRPRKYHKLELDNNDLHDFSDIVKVDRWYSEQCIRFY